MFDEDITIEKQAEYEADLKKRALISGGVMLIADMKHTEHTPMFVAMLVLGLVSTIIMVKSRFTESWFEYRQAALRKHG